MDIDQAGQSVQALGGDQGRRAVGGDRPGSGYLDDFSRGDQDVLCRGECIRIGLNDRHAGEQQAIRQGHRRRLARGAAGEQQTDAEARQSETA
jgi:hypothetical protein